MAYFTRESLSRIVGQTRTINESVTASLESARAQVEYPLPPKGAPRTLVFDIFLSHSSIDEHDVNLAYSSFTKMGYVVYLDRIVDPYLTPDHVSRATADILRTRMAQSRSMFVATSSNTSKSKWVPWELGFADGWNGKAAILPILSSPHATFRGQEYFEIYPVVQESPVSARKPDSPLIVDIAITETWGQWVKRPRVV